MNLHERAACDGLLPDDDTPISAHMEWMREHVERLAWELESTSRELKEATSKLQALRRQQPDDGKVSGRDSLLNGTGVWS
jgi:hypothetical protein